MNLFEFESYKDLVKSKIHSFPKRGHGQFLRIAKLLGVHTTMVTHIFSGDSNLSVEQALQLCDYFHLNKLESEFFVTLVQYERAANSQSRRFFKDQIQKLRTRALNLSEILEARSILDEASQATFYSDWYYVAIWLYCVIRKPKSREEISEQLGVPVQVVYGTVEFLLRTGLLAEKNGELTGGLTSTFIGKDSPFLPRHHSNWRLKTLERIHEITEEELVYTNPITLSRKDFLKVRKEIVHFIESFKAISEPSPPETLCYLTIDWLKVWPPEK